MTETLTNCFERMYVLPNKEKSRSNRVTVLSDLDLLAVNVDDDQIKLLERISSLPNPFGGDLEELGQDIRNEHQQKTLSRLRKNSTNNPAPNPNKR